ncbi:MAG TPA: TetR/AcrR family transcriptional regulator [Aldersonia sp.]
MAKPTTRSPARHELVLDQLMQAAEQLFARQGVAGTSLQELADAVGLTRTGIYHYIRGKDELLEMLVRGFTVEAAEQLQALATETDRGAAIRLRKGITAMATRVAEHPQRFRLLLTSEEAFPEPLATQHRKARRDTLAALTELVSQAITEGSCRPVDPELAAFSLAGVANWVAFWYPRQRSGPSTPAQVAEQLADIALAGVLSARDMNGENAIPQALALLHEDVRRLEHLLGERTGSG